MKNDLIFPSYTEFIQKSEIIKTRQERLIQVRQQSKKTAAEFLEKMRKQAEKQYENTERQILNEICELHSKELAAMRRVYEECVHKINQEHYSKSVKTKPNQNNLIPRIGIPKKPMSFEINVNNNKLKTCSPKKCTLEGSQSSGYISISTDKQDPKKYGASVESLKSNPFGSTKTISTVTTREQDQISEKGNKTSSLNQKSKTVKRTPLPRQTHTSIYHEKCVPSNLKRNEPQKKNLSPVRTVISQHSETNRDIIIMNEDRLTKVTNPALSSYIKRTTEDFLNNYTEQVHDRIRILDQKEKMLQRRLVLLPEFSERVTSLKKHTTYETDANMAEKEFNLTESCEPVSTQISNPLPVDKKHSSLEKGVKPVHKEVCNTAVQTSRLHEKRRRRCKRATLSKNEDMIIFIRNQQNEITCTTKNSIPRDLLVNQSSSSTPRETESSVNESEKITLSVEKIVRATTNEYKDRPHIQKLHNWRQLFSNGDKLSESSYYSPPTTLRNEKKTVKSKKKCKRHLVKKNIADDSEKDIEYYVAKLLLMSPESVENLNSASEETITSVSVDEIEYERPKTPSLPSNDNESMDEEEFIRRMLEVNIPPKQNITPTVDAPEPTHHREPCITVPSNNDSATITETDIESKTSSMSLSGIPTDNVGKPSKLSKPEDKVLEDAVPTDLTLDSRLSGWIGTSMRRTLEASAINSTSSYEDSDKLRQVDQLVSLFERNEYFLSSGKSSSTNQFSFSPIPVPDIHLNIPQISGTST